MLYFAYGSNLDPELMRTRCPSVKTVGLAALREHRLAFPVFSQEWGGGVAGIQLAHGDTLWGVLYEIDEAGLAALDEAQGFRGPGNQHNIYDRDTASVELTRADDGSFPRRVRAAIYLARPSNPSPPSRRYLDTIVRGAVHHRLPDEYLARLRTIPVGAEPEPEPEAKT